MNVKHPAFIKISEYSEGFADSKTADHIAECAECKAVLKKIKATRQYVAAMKNLKIKRKDYNSSLMKRIQGRKRGVFRNIIPFSAAAVFLIIILSGVLNNIDSPKSNSNSGKSDSAFNFTHTAPQDISTDVIESMVHGGKIIGKNSNSIVIESTYAEYKSLIIRLGIKQDMENETGLKALHEKTSVNSENKNYNSDDRVRFSIYIR